jgi:hypothetical protein
MPGPMRGDGGSHDHYRDDISQHTNTRRGSDFGTGMYMTSEYSEFRYDSQGAQFDHAQVSSQRRPSMHNIPDTSPDFYGHTSSMHRRESLDFVPGHNRYPDGVPVVASTQEMRLYMNDDRYRSDRGPIYGHHRNPSSDMGSSTLSSSPTSLSSAGMVRYIRRNRGGISISNSYNHGLLNREARPFMTPTEAALGSIAPPTLTRI